MTQDMFDGLGEQPTREDIVPGAVLLRGFAVAAASDLLDAVDTIVARAPFRHLVTPGGHRMSVAMTNCGAYGWVSDEHGYRYTERNPANDAPWPEMPASFVDLASEAAAQTGCAPFIPDACLVNRYEPGARMSLHQDRNERDFFAPIVSVSLGIPAIFLFGGMQRSDRARRLRLVHGDVVVWGGPARLAFHGIAPLAVGYHPRTGHHRINLTFRKVR